MHGTSIERKNINSFLIFILFVASPVFAQDAANVDILRRMGKAFATIAEKTSPAVVGLKTEKNIGSQESPYEPLDPFGDDFFDKFFRRQNPQRRYNQPRALQVAQGSGFIISAEGYIMSNNHLVGDSQKISVTLNDGREFTAKLIGCRPGFRCRYN